MKVHLAPPSPRAIRVLAVMHHLGLDAEIVPVDLVGGDHLKPAFVALNPNRKMPVLEDDGFVLWESNAIIQYLAAKAGDRGLWPAEPRSQADVSRWQCWDLAHWDPACATFLFENFVKPVILKSGEPDPAALAKGAELFHRAAKVLDGQLRGKKFVTGGTLTIADFCLGAPLNYTDMARLPLDPYAEIRRWYGTLTALPAWQKTLSQSAIPAAAAA